jgi:hypothetical protein
MKTIKVIHVKVTGLIIALVVIIGFFYLFTKVLDIQLTHPAKVYYEPDKQEQTN